MSSNLHVNLDEANKHTPKGFDSAVNNTFLTKDESGLSTYRERMMLDKAINFVDGTLAPPTTANGDIYVLTGSGTVEAGWGGADFDDWVIFQNGIAVTITPLAGYLCYDTTASQWKEYDGTDWVTADANSTNLSEGTVTNTTVDVNSDTGTNATLLEASTSRAGVMSKAKFDEVEANNAKVSNATHTGEVTGSTALTVHPTAISNKLALGSLAGTEEFLINDGGTLKKVLASNVGGGGGATEVGTGTDSIQQIGATASGFRAIALGINALSAGSTSVVVGSNATTILGADDGVALGVQSTMNADRGIAVGYLSEVNNSGANGISLGFNSLVNGSGGVAIGSNTTAGQGGIAMGASASATASNVSMALGENMKVTADYALMLGGSTLPRTNSTTRSLEVNFNEATSTFRIGQSVDSWINTSANFGIGETSPTAKLHVKGSGTTSGTTALLVQNATPAELFKITDDGSLYTVGFQGFTGTGAYTNFTIKNGIITAAS
jgi:hypothetical protein